MAELVQVADAAYPAADWSFLPPDVKALGGYVGGHTPHPWTLSEVAHFESTGRAWWGIWTAPDQRALTMTDATQDAANMAQGLALLKRPKVMPVFWDVEYAAYMAAPQAAESAASAWCAAMNAFGYPHAGWYGPCHSSAPWRACWTGQAPATLPLGVWGVQYDHALSGDRYDISIFDASLFLEANAMTQPQVDSIIARIDKLQSVLTTYDTQNSEAPTIATVVHLLLAMRDGDTGHHDLPKLQSRLDDLEAKVATLAAGSGAPLSYSGTVTLSPQTS